MLATSHNSSFLRDTTGEQPVESRQTHLLIMVSYPIPEVDHSPSSHPLPLPPPPLAAPLSFLFAHASAPTRRPLPQVLRLTLRQGDIRGAARALAGWRERAISYEPTPPPPTPPPTPPPPMPPPPPPPAGGPDARADAESGESASPQAGPAADANGSGRWQAQKPKQTRRSMTGHVHKRGGGAA